ncbi:hypothetical protein [Winogradskyella sp.]
MKLAKRIAMFLLMVFLISGIYPDWSWERFICCALLGTWYALDYRTEKL